MTVTPLLIAVAVIALPLTSCGPTMEFERAPEHLEAAVSGADAIPELVTQLPAPPMPEPEPPEETYTVVVTDVPVRELLFTLARDANINVDVHSGIEGTVTMNALDQTLPQLLDRISRQVDLRYALDGPNLLIMPDLPYWQNYRLDYVNVVRNTNGEVTVATRVSSTGGSVDEESESGGGDQELGNISSTTVLNSARNNFWGLVEANLTQIIRTDQPESSDEESQPIVMNPVAGTLSVFATQSQHNQVQAYLDQVSANAKRQVLIEVTIVEVILSDRYQLGVDWSRLATDSAGNPDGLSFLQTLTGGNLSAPPLFAMTYDDLNDDGSGFSAAVRMLEEFGDTEVLSSPRILALNNQTALLKVVDEVVYFTIEQEIREASDQSPERTIITSEVRTVPVGFIMSVTPQINGNGNVSLNIRPTITRIIDFAVDPAPRLAGADFDNLVPEIHVNEIESLLEVADGQTVILGGLMQDEIRKDKDGIPGLSRIPGIGHLFSYRDEQLIKSELVMFLRPTVVRGAGVDPASMVRVNPTLGRTWSAGNLRPEADEL